jgi:hypothetical protein
VEVLLDEVDVLVVPAAADSTLPASALATSTGAADVDELDVVEVLVDAVDEEVKGTAGAGGASKRMNCVKLTTSELSSEIKLALGGDTLSTVEFVSSGSGLGAHCALAAC